MPGRPGLGDSWRWMRKEMVPALGGQARGACSSGRALGQRAGRTQPPGVQGRSGGLGLSSGTPGEDGVGGPRAVGAASQERGPAP